MFISVLSNLFLFSSTKCRIPRVKFYVLTALLLFLFVREGSSLEEVVEKQADLIEYLKQHNTLLSKRLLNLSAQHWPGPTLLFPSHPTLTEVRLKYFNAETEAVDLK